MNTEELLELKKSQKCVVIVGFSGIGKTESKKILESKKIKVLELDICDFKFDENNNVKKEYKKEYIKSIKKNIGKLDFLFLPLDIDVLDILRDNKVFHYLIYPDLVMINSFLYRYSLYSKELSETMTSETMTSLIGICKDNINEYCGHFCIRSSYYLDSIINVIFLKTSETKVNTTNF